MFFGVLIYFGLIMFSKLCKFSKLVMYLNSCSMDLGHDTLAVIKDVEKPGDKGRKEDNCRGQKREHPDCWINDGGKRKDEKTPRTVKFTPLIMPINKILVQIKGEHYLKWLRPLHSSLNVRDKKKYGWFHKDHGYYTEDCRDLKE